MNIEKPKVVEHTAVAFNIDPTGYFQQLDRHLFWESLGLLPDIIANVNQAEPLKTELQANYGFPLYWLGGAIIDEHGIYHYQEVDEDDEPDPPLYPLAQTEIKGTKIFIYQYGIVALQSQDGAVEWSRMD